MFQNQLIGGGNAGGSLLSNPTGSLLSNQPTLGVGQGILGAGGAGLGGLGGAPGGGGTSLLGFSGNNPFQNPALTKTPTFGIGGGSLLAGANTSTPSVIGAGQSTFGTGLGGTSLAGTMGGGGGGGVGTTLGMGLGGGGLGTGIAGAGMGMSFGGGGIGTGLGLQQPSLTGGIGGGLSMQQKPLGQGFGLGLGQQQPQQQQAQQTQLGGGSGMFGTMQGAQIFQPNLQQKPPKFSLSIINVFRSKTVGNLDEGCKRFVEQYSATLNNNDKELQMLKEENKNIIDLYTKIRDQGYKFTQNAKLFYLKLKQARQLIDSMSSDYLDFDRVVNTFEMFWSMLQMGRMPSIEFPGKFIVDITQYYAIRLDQLQKKVSEIEALLEEPDITSNADDYEKIVMIMDEFYKYYLSVASKILEMNEHIAKFKAKFIEICKTQGFRDVDRHFEEGHKEIAKVDRLKDLESISNQLLQKMNK